MKLYVPTSPPSPDVRIPITDEEISTIEGLVGLLLPLDYLDLLCRYGGMSLGNEERYVVTPILDPCSIGGTTKVEALFGFFFSLTHDCDLELVAQAYKTKIPRNTVAIGRAGRATSRI